MASVVPFKRFDGSDPVASVKTSNTQDKLAKLMSKVKRQKSTPVDKQPDFIGVHPAADQIAATEPIEDDNGKASKKKKRKSKKVVDVESAVQEAIEDVPLEAKEEEELEPALQQIESIKHRKPQPMKAPPPDWIANPIYFAATAEDRVAISDDKLGLSDNFIERLAANKISHFLPVQRTLIPSLVLALKCSKLVRQRDICVSSPTGSGKTLAFALPILNHLQHRVVRAIRALVVLPVRDLAMQVFQVFNCYAAKTTLRVGLAVGKKSFDDEVKDLLVSSADGSRVESAIDILVCTPGRLVDLIVSAPGFSLSKLEVLVLDEADRMMEETQHDWIRQIDKAVFGGDGSDGTYCCCSSPCRPDEECRRSYRISCPCNVMNGINCRPLLKLLFSATMTSDVEKLETVSLFQPQLYTAVRLNPHAADENENGQQQEPADESHGLMNIPSELSEKLLITSQQEKLVAICYLIATLGWRRVLVFTGSVESARRLVLLLRHVSSDLAVADYSSRLPDKERVRIGQQFEAGHIHVVVASDIMARGIDLANVEYVVSYDQPKTAAAYTHRVGRTARAGRSGTAVTLVNRDARRAMESILRQVHGGRDVDLQRIKIPPREAKRLTASCQLALAAVAKDL